MKLRKQLGIRPDTSESTRSITVLVCFARYRPEAAEALSPAPSSGISS